MRQGEASVDDVLHQQDVVARDGVRQVLYDLNDPAGLGTRSVRPNAEKIDLEGQVDGAREVGRENEAALQHANHRQGAARIVARDLGAELAHALTDSIGRKQADWFFLHGQSPY